MLLREAKEILKKNGYLLKEETEENKEIYDIIDSIKKLPFLKEAKIVFERNGEYNQIRKEFAKETDNGYLTVAAGYNFKGRVPNKNDEKFFVSVGLSSTDRKWYCEEDKKFENLDEEDILDFCIKAYKKVINDLEEKIEKGKNRGSTIYDYIDELENIEPGLGQDFIGELIDSCDFIYRDDAGNYYDSSVGSDSMTDDPLELIDGAMDYANLVGEYGFPEEYAKGVNNG